MPRSPVLLALALLAAAVPASLQAQAPAQAPAPAVVGTSVTARARVEAIDLASREVTLLRADGRRTTIVAGPEVRNLDQVRVGDTVVLEYREAIAAELVRPGDARPPAEAVAGAGRAEPGQRPAAAAAEAVRVRVRIDAVDREAGTVTFTGPRGTQRTITVQAPAMRDFVRGLSAGEEVDVTYVEAIAVRVEPAR